MIITFVIDTLQGTFLVLLQYASRSDIDIRSPRDHIDSPCASPIAIGVFLSVSDRRVVQICSSFQINQDGDNHRIQRSIDHRSAEERLQFFTRAN